LRWPSDRDGATASSEFQSRGEALSNIDVENCRDVVR
jgi:hypothetical protein